MAVPVADVTSLLQDIQAKGKEIELNDDQSRQALLASAKALISALESPTEKILKISWHEPIAFAAIRMCIDLKLFEKMQEDGGSIKSVEQLAKLTGADPKLLGRVLKHLAAADIVEETGTDEYAPNAVSTLLVAPPAQGAVVTSYDALAAVSPKLVEFFQKTKYQNPTDKDNSPWNYARNISMHFFKWILLPGNELQAEAFYNLMKFKTLGKKWFETVPISELFADFRKDDPNAVLMVDVGGNTGHDILDFHKAWPNQAGRLILEDLPEVLNSADKEALKPVEVLGHDFFTPQPVKAAKAYYLNNVFHDWPDASCKKILSNLKSALEPGYSKILINEVVVPDRGAQWYTTSIDLLMMVIHASAERREQQWRAVIESAGLKISKIWDCGGALESLIEVELI